MAKCKNKSLDDRVKKLEAKAKADEEQRQYENIKNAITSIAKNSYLSGFEDGKDRGIKDGKEYWDKHASTYISLSVALTTRDIWRMVKPKED